MKKGDKLICVKNYIRKNKFGEILDEFKKDVIYEIFDIYKYSNGSDRIFIYKDNSIEFRSFRDRPKFSKYFKAV